ncbi:MAG: response regulator transcription factor, partial [Oscillospiraceae bacterium]|nr:response regulator transcription factor [Oscillospiraceae bacterium]
LDAGADDYLVKPFGMLEMISRVKAVLRRSAPVLSHFHYTVGPLELDTKSHTVTGYGERITLTLKEFELLRVLIAKPDTAFTRDSLYTLVWGSEFIGETRTVDMHIRTLRVKLGPCGEMIQTVRGVGYMLGELHET